MSINVLYVLPPVTPYDWINPFRLTTHSMCEPDWVAYVMWKESETRKRPTRVVVSRGGLGLKIGDKVHLYHDTTSLSLGYYRVVGVSRHDNNRTVGEVPDRLIKLAVVK